MLTYNLLAKETEEAKQKNSKKPTVLKLHLSKRGKQFNMYVKELSKIIYKN